MRVLDGMKAGRPRAFFTTAADELRLLLFFEDNPGATIASAAEFFQCSKSLVEKTLRRVRARIKAETPSTPEGGTAPHNSASLPGCATPGEPAPEKGA